MAGRLLNFWTEEAKCLNSNIYAILHYIYFASEVVQAETDRDGMMLTLKVQTKIPVATET